jgi:hypothetical protein
MPKKHPKKRELKRSGPELGVGGEKKGAREGKKASA